MPQISIVVPVYKVEQYIHRCVDSILAQTYKDFQLILVDDGSPDNCGSICDEYAKNDSRVIVIHQENGGPSSARNAGIEWIFLHSESEWITYVDGDDWIHPKYLDSLVSVARKLQADLVIAEYALTSGEYEYSQCIASPVCTNAEQFFCDHQILSTVVWGKLCKLDCFRHLLFPVGIINEDEYITYKILFDAASVAYIQTPLYYYYKNPEGIMSREWTLKSLDALGGYEAQLKFFRERKYKKAYHSARDRYIVALQYHLTQFKLRYPQKREKIVELTCKLKWMMMGKNIKKKMQSLVFLLKNR